MKRFPSPRPAIVAALALIPIAAVEAVQPSAATVDLSAALFASVPASGLSAADRTQIATHTPLALRNGVVVSSMRGCETAMHPEVVLEDLNRDGSPEVFISAGNACTSGMTGRSVWLYAKRGDGRWVQLLDVIAAGYRVLPSATFGWHDIALGGRGFCEGLWRLGAEGEYGYARSIQADGTPCPEQ